MRIHILHILCRRLLSVATFVAVFVAVGCGSDSEAMRVVAEAERLRVDKPEEALGIIRRVSLDDFSRAEHRARYALVCSEVYYYNFVDIADDSLARPMRAYYIDSDSHAERARALVQVAFVARNRGELAEAMVALLEAEVSLEHVDDLRLEGLLHRTKGDIYSDGCLFANALEEYGQAKRCFDALALEYHAASVQYDMGGMLVQLRDFERAEEVLDEALAYAIESGNREFECGVLHELLDLSIYRDDYEACRRYLDVFVEDDCLLFGDAHYNAVAAMLLSREGCIDEALHLVSEAATMGDNEWADIEYARYIIYRNAGDTEEALRWQEHSKNAQDRLMLEVLEQPVLNVEVEMLQRDLRAERRERELVAERNAIIFVAVAILVVAIILFAWYRLRRKNREIAQYVETVSELRLTLRTLPEAMASSVGSLYRDRFIELNDLCETYYDHSGSARHKNMVFNKLVQTIEAIKSDAKRLEELESAVNEYRGGLMLRLNELLPKLSERDRRVSLYLFAGFSNRAIAIFIDSDPVSVSKIRYNIKQKIKSVGGEGAEVLIDALSEK